MTSSITVDLFSDTATRPTPGMRKAMAAAEVGDEQRHEDPTTRALCERVAGLLGKESAMFLPSGIMSNVVALLTHCRPGDEVICSADAHIIGSEGGGAAIFGGISIAPIDVPTGVYDVAALRARLRPARARSPGSRLAHLEQTTNKGGGTVWPLESVKTVAAAARDAGLAVHMDGARLFNAVVASGEAAAAFAGPCDSVWIDLSKGLGCPVGSVLAGDAAFIEEGWVWKHRLGGAMRQSGVLAAAGLYALDNHVERLAQDHENAALLAARIQEIPGITIAQDTVETNLVFFDVAATGKTAGAVASLLQEQGVRIGAQGESRMRAVTHLDVSADDVLTAVDALRKVVQS